MLFFSKFIPNLLNKTSAIKSSQIIRSFSILTKPSIFSTLRSTIINNSPVVSLPLVQVRGVKVRSAVKKRCKDCYSVRRSGILYIRCKVHPRHKQRQG